MSNDTKTLIQEQNIISLRTAIVIDDGSLVSFILMSEGMESSIPGNQDFEKFDHTWLYRRKKSFIEEFALKWSFVPVEQGVRPLAFENPPELNLLWADSGHSVALCLNREPWAFIHEEKNHGYSKGILKPKIGNPWNQELFERTFFTK